jgi:hypothetical protein
MYETRTERDWKRVKVKTNKVLRNGVIEIPSGTVCEIYRKAGGFALKTQPCVTCGVAVMISKVPPRDVDVWEVQT